MVYPRLRLEFEKSDLRKVLDKLLESSEARPDGRESHVSVELLKYAQACIDEERICSVFFMFANATSCKSDTSILPEGEKACSMLGLLSHTISSDAESTFHRPCRNSLPSALPAHGYHSDCIRLIDNDISHERVRYLQFIIEVLGRWQ